MGWRGLAVSPRGLGGIRGLVGSMGGEEGWRDWRASRVCGGNWNQERGDVGRIGDAL